MKKRNLSIWFARDIFQKKNSGRLDIFKVSNLPPCIGRNSEKVLCIICIIRLSFYEVGLTFRCHIIIIQVDDKLNPLPGITRDAMLLKMTDEQWDSIISCHLTGTFLFTQTLARQMVKAKAHGTVQHQIMIFSGTFFSQYARSRVVMMWHSSSVNISSNIDSVTPNIILLEYYNI